MPRKASAILAPAERREQVGVTRRNLKDAVAAVRDHDREISRVTRESEKLLKAIAKKRAAAAKVVERLQQQIDTYASS